MEGTCSTMNKGKVKVTVQIRNKMSRLKSLITSNRQTNELKRGHTCTRVRPGMNLATAVPTTA
jgi:hypothetical protein